MAKYLDYLGFSYFWQRAKSYISTVVNYKLNTRGSVWYGTSSTAASTAAKVVTCENFVLTKGAVISVTFTTANTAATPTLNVNSTGATSILFRNSTTVVWDVNDVLTFIYDGTNYCCIGKQNERVTLYTGGDITPGLTTVPFTNIPSTCFSRLLIVYVCNEVYQHVAEVNINYQSLSESPGNMITTSLMHQHSNETSGNIYTSSLGIELSNSVRGMNIATHSGCSYIINTSSKTITSAAVSNSNFEITEIYGIL